MRGRVRHAVRAVTGSSTARESVWGMALEGSRILVTMVSFTCLGRRLGPDAYGGYASLYALSGPLLTLAASGVSLALVQHLVREPEDAEEIARSCISISLLFGSVLVAVTAVAASAVIDVAELTLVAIVALLVTEFVASPLVQLAAGVSLARDGFPPSARIRLLFTAARGVLIVVLFAAGSLTLTTLGIGQLALTTVLALGALRRVGHRYHLRLLPGRIRSRHVRTNLTYSASISAFSVQNNGDQVVLAANRFTTDTGLYAAAYRIISLGMTPVATVLEVTHKRFLETGEQRGQQVRLATRLTAFGAAYAAAFAVVLVVIAPVIPAILGSEFDGSVSILRWGAPLIFFQVITVFPLNGLMGLGKNGVRSIIIVAAAVVTVALYVVLIPDHGWRGALAGSMLGDAALALVSWTTLVVQQRRFDARSAAAVLAGDADDAAGGEGDPAEGAEGGGGAAAARVGP